ncbi:hypothetical protein F2Q69_00023012 [Brassica cretica]|uniref:Secreted protein n=1 Tax=Brassica cretica TaxID=69181 RepID=A0A8S9QHD1_BRACR|nr:hypothetical protein F2Q69_00023012 [Brassica cretica]
MSFTSLVVHLFSLSLAPACLPSFLSTWHMTITSCLLALFLRLSCEKYMKGLEFLQVKERTAACAEMRSSVKGGGPSEFFCQSVVVLFSLRLAPACLPSFFRNWHMTITSCLLALFLRLSCEKHMKGLEFRQFKERTTACAESAEAAGQLSPLSLALS